MDDRRRERTDRLLGAGLCGLAAAAGLPVVLFAGAGPPKALPDREGAALMSAAFVGVPILSGSSFLRRARKESWAENEKNMSKNRKEGKPGGGERPGDSRSASGRPARGGTRRRARS
jgi:hypothetical protein